MNIKLQLLFVFFTGIIIAQEDAWVYFTDKPDASYYMNNPLEMLSQRALDRRTNQNIQLDDLDIPISIIYINEIENTSGISVLAKSKWLNALHIRGTQTDIQALTNYNFVDHIQFANHTLNPSNRSSNAQRANNIYDKFEVLADFNYGNSNNQIQMLNGHLLHEQDYTGQGKIIAILDAGFPGVNTAQPFQRLFDNNLILGGYNFPDRDTNIYTRHYHGTNVLSTMGGFSDGELVGTAPDAQYYLFITEDSTSENPVEESYWVEALEMADSLGVDIINSSLGYTNYDNINYSYDYSKRNGEIGFASRGASLAMSKGIVCVVSAGNDGNKQEKHISIPADAENILAVGAVTNTESYASFSSIGTSFDGRVKPDVCAKGQGVTISNPSGNILSNGNGTSFASPILAGMIASFWSAVPNLTASQVIKYVKESADQFSTPDQYKGYGVPDFQLAITNVLSSQNVTLSVVSIYPNPFTNVLKIKQNKNVIGKFVLYNNLGMKVLDVNVINDEQDIQLETLSSGIYLYDFSSNNINLQGKLIKQ
ncbi:peptidase S8 [Flavobacterium sp. 316]|uniref:S8 family serine peptidase n=1 Tax=Flavobacterium sp. 316 TaxID=1603293 RepID=UPI0005E4F791|nr:S8 family serine peptidase [Flavobacterium sp. 316]KIX22532.1 peptidase S8 [Flavobacterium sp. 316]